MMIEYARAFLFFMAASLTRSLSLYIYIHILFYCYLLLCFYVLVHIIVLIFMKLQVKAEVPVSIPNKIRVNSRNIETTGMSECIHNDSNLHGDSSQQSS